MMSVSLVENVKFEAECRGHKVIIDQPEEDGGSDAGMSPIELFVASLGSCIGYFASVFCRRRKIAAGGLKVDLSWGWSENPHRIGSIEARITLPAKLAQKERAGLLRMVEECTVHNTLKVKPEIRILLSL
ncbi:MAG: OsmC family protein [Promethearchaeati archaeon SRVP18_Atabeyarchaeia-1]